MCGIQAAGDPVDQQARFPVVYKGEEVGLYAPDLIVYHNIIVDVKTIDHITDHELGLMINYLRTTGKQLGLVINFKRAKLEWRRVVL